MKYCKHCKKILVMREKETPSHFAERKFCNRECLNVYQIGRPKTKTRNSKHEYFNESMQRFYLGR